MLVSYMIKKGLATLDQENKMIKFHDASFTSFPMVGHRLLPMYPPQQSLIEKHCCKRLSRTTWP